MLYELWVVAAVLGYIYRNSNQIEMPSFHYPIFLIVPFFIQIGSMQLLDTGRLSEALFTVLINLSYLLLLISLWMNRHIPGFGIFFVGVLANSLVIWLNDGRMPVSVDALYAAGLENLIPELKVGLTKHQLMSDSTVLSVLGDWIPLNRPYGEHEIISIGDVLQSTGIAFLIGKIIRGHKF